MTESPPARHSAAEYGDAPPPCEFELLAEVGWLRSKDGLLGLLDEHWPPDMSPVEDPGPRVRSLARRLARAEEAFADIEALHQPGDYGTCACCAWPYPCQTVQYVWGAEDDRG